jgi:hypothetical protein
MASIIRTGLNRISKQVKHFHFGKIRLRRKDWIPFKPNVKAFLVGRPVDIRLDQANLIINILK